MTGVLRGAVGFVVAALAWEVFARSGLFPVAVTPPLLDVLRALGQLVATGEIFMHVGSTMARIFAGLALAALVGIPLGLVMGRVRRVERLVLPLVSVLSPIPSLAWVPLFILWFGLGNAAAIALVLYAAIFPLVLNAWAGVRSVNGLWLRAAQTMGADRRAVFLKVVLPGALPFVIAGLRQAFARSWIAVVGGEMIASTTRGLGFVIFDAKEFLNTDVMLAALLVIGVVGLGFERWLFQGLERRTVGRWGMVRMTRT